MGATNWQLTDTALFCYAELHSKVSRAHVGRVLIYVCVKCGHVSTLRRLGGRPKAKCTKHVLNARILGTLLLIGSTGEAKVNDDPQQYIRRLTPPSTIRWQRSFFFTRSRHSQRRWRRAAAWWAVTSQPSDGVFSRAVKEVLKLNLIKMTESRSFVCFRCLWV